MINKSRTINIRLVEESDAEFILKLRLDEKYNQFLSDVNPDMQAQRDWIKKYKNDEFLKKQFYFIIERNDGVPCGTVRIYDIKGDSFCWGSWILNENKTRYAALESAFLVYQFGFNELGLKKSHFEVRKGNEKVISFHKKMGAVKILEDDLNEYFNISQEAVLEAKQKLSAKI
ncbi:GNAT family N-acetyltransferase [Comamonas fluminis]|uniref:GNAT family N-acetyltransferase n=1 Tax=Comamonas fluminis TaxID=2796366 RepID=UPI001C444245|nr:GNAT family N-acetyltransferase [Comamonas fluminis]